MTVNSFLADGGDNFVVLRRRTDRLGGEVDLDALVTYFGIELARVARARRTESASSRRSSHHSRPSSSSAGRWTTVRVMFQATSPPCRVLGWSDDVARAPGWLTCPNGVQTRLDISPTPLGTLEEVEDVVDEIKRRCSSSLRRARCRRRPRAGSAASSPADHCQTLAGTLAAGATAVTKSLMLSRVSDQIDESNDPPGQAGIPPRWPSSTGLLLLSMVGLGSRSSPRRVMARIVAPAAT